MSVAGTSPRVGVASGLLATIPIRVYGVVPDPGAVLIEVLIIGALILSMSPAQHRLRTPSSRW